jgi:hypothetical protein
MCRIQRDGACAGSWFPYLQEILSWIKIRAKGLLICTYICICIVCTVYVVYESSWIPNRLCGNPNKRTGFAWSLITIIIIITTTSQFRLSSLRLETGTGLTLQQRALLNFYNVLKTCSAGCRQAGTQLMTNPPGNTDWDWDSKLLNKSNGPRFLSGDFLYALVFSWRVLRFQFIRI